MHGPAGWASLHCVTTHRAPPRSLPHLFTLQLVVRRNPAPDPRFQPETAAASLAGYDFKPGARALFLGRSYYGCMATILPDASAGLTKKVRARQLQRHVGGTVQQRRPSRTVRHAAHARSWGVPPTPLPPACLPWCAGPAAGGGAASEEVGVPSLAGARPSQRGHHRAVGCAHSAGLRADMQTLAAARPRATN